MGEVGADTRYSSADPYMTPGERYLLLLHVEPNKLPRIVGGAAGAVRLDPEASLPTNQQLNDEWAEVCLAQ